MIILVLFAKVLRHSGRKLLYSDSLRNGTTVTPYDSVTTCFFDSKNKKERKKERRKDASLTFQYPSDRTEIKKKLLPKRVSSKCKSSSHVVTQSKPTNVLHVSVARVLYESASVSRSVR